MWTETKALYAEQKPICFICKWTLFLDHHICRDQPQYFNESSCDWKHTLLSALFFYHRSTQLSFNRRKKGRVGCQPAFITCCCEHNLVPAFAWTRIFYLNLKAFTDLKKRLCAQMLTVYCCYIFISMQISFLHVHLLIFRDEGAALPLLWQTQTLPMRCITATSSKPLKYLSSRAAIWSRIFILRLQAPSGAGCVCLCFCSSPASCSSAVSTRPPSSRQTVRNTAPLPQRSTGTPVTEVSSWTDWSVCCFPHCWNSTPACLLVPMWLQSLSPLLLLSLCMFFPPFHNIPSLYGVCILLLHKVRTQHTYEVEFLPILDGPHDISCGVNHTGQYEVDWLLLSFITKTITCSNE